MARPTSPESRERLLAAAERLFGERGYHAVSMADIASAVGVRKASLYHHVPGGKEELFVEIASRAFARHRQGLSKALAETDEQLEPQLRAASRWLISQAPLGLLAMLQNDMPALGETHVRELERQLLESLWIPLTRVFTEAGARGEISASGASSYGVSSYVGAFVSMMDGLTYIGTATPAGGGAGRPMEEVADDLIAMMVRGLR